MSLYAAGRRPASSDAASKISQIRTLAVERIGRRIARASEEDLGRLIDGINEIISSP